MLSYAALAIKHHRREKESKWRLSARRRVSARTGYDRESRPPIIETSALVRSILSVIVQSCEDEGGITFVQEIILR